MNADLSADDRRREKEAVPGDDETEMDRREDGESGAAMRRNPVSCELLAFRAIHPPSLHKDARGGQYFEWQRNQVSLRTTRVIISLTRPPITQSDPTHAKEGSQLNPAHSSLPPYDDCEQQDDDRDRDNRDNKVGDTSEIAGDAEPADAAFWRDTDGGRPEG